MTNIIRIKHNVNKPYVCLSKKTINLPLSLEARGLWTFLMAKPDNWEIIPKLLAKQVGTGRDKIYRILQELIKHKLCRHLIEKQQNSKGQWITLSNEYILFEEPYNEQHTDFLKTGNPENQEALKNKEREEEEASTEKEFSPEAEHVLRKTVDYLRDENILLSTSLLRKLITHYGTLRFKQAFQETAQDWGNNHKKIKSFKAILLYKLRELEEYC